MMQACKRLQHSIQLQVLISSLNTKVSNYLIAKTVISSNDSCFVTRLSDVGHASSQDCPMWDILRHRNVRCGTCTVTRLSDVGHASTQDCSMRDMFRLRTVRCGPCSVTGLSGVGHVPQRAPPSHGHISVRLRLRIRLLHTDVVCVATESQLQTNPKQRPTLPAHLTN